MKMTKVLSTAILFGLTATIVPAYAQEHEQEKKPEQKQQPAKPAQHEQQAKPAKLPQQAQHQEQAQRRRETARAIWQWAPPRCSCIRP